MTFALFIVGEDFILDGSQSSDIGGVVTEYRWTNAAFASGTVTTASPTLNVAGLFSAPLAPGVHVFSLVVVDSSANTSSAAQVQVIVIDDQVPTAVLQATDTGGTPLPGNASAFGADFVLDGSASSDSGGGSITQYRWTNPSFVGGEITTTTPTLTVTPALTGGTPLPVGPHIFGLEVVDNSGNKSTVAQIEVTVIEVQAPIADAGADFNVPLGQQAQLDGSGSSDPDNDIITFAWSLFEKPAASVLSDANIIDKNQALADSHPTWSEIMSCV